MRANNLDSRTVPNTESARRIQRPVVRSATKLLHNLSAKRLIAISFTLLMVLSPFALCMPGSDADSAAKATAPVPIGDGYGYVLTYNGDNTNITNVQAYVGNGPTATSGTLQSNTYRSDTTLGSFWKFDSHTGLGPFNSYYAAFNIESGNNLDDSHEHRLNKTAGKIAYVLDPNNLKQTLNGTPINHNNSQYYNIMLVIPAVYWVADGTHLYLSSSPDFEFGSVTKSGMIAYAHTTSNNNSMTGSNATLHPYIALGVYEGATMSTNAGTTLISQSDRTPSSANMNTLRDQALRNTAVDSTSSYQVVNFYQWTLYKMMSYTVMGSKNAQKMIGNGNVSTSSSSKTGQADDKSWYYGNTSNQTTVSKLFLENTWGSAVEVVGEAYVGEHTIYVGNTLGGKNLGNEYRKNGDPLNSSGETVRYWVKNSSGMVYRAITSAKTVSKYWDYPSGIADKNYSGNLGNSGDKYGKTSYYSSWEYKYAIRVGGGYNTGNDAGLSWIGNGFYTSSSCNGRLAYVMSAEAVTSANKTITYVPNTGDGLGPIGVKATGQTMLEENTFTPPQGLAFMSWNTLANGTGVGYFPGSSLEINDNLTLYAIWTNTVKITLNNNYEPEVGGITYSVVGDGTVTSAGGKLEITVAASSTYSFEKVIDDDGDHLGVLVVKDTEYADTYTFTIKPTGADSNTATYGFYRLVDLADMEITGENMPVSEMTLTAEWRLIKPLNYNLQNAYLIAPGGDKVTGSGQINKELAGITITIYPGIISGNDVADPSYIVTSATATYDTSQTCDMTYDQNEGTCYFVMPSFETDLNAVAKKKALDLRVTPFSYRYGTEDSIAATKTGTDTPSLDSIRFYYYDGDEWILWQTGETLAEGITSTILPPDEYLIHLMVKDDDTYADYSSDSVTFTVTKGVATWKTLPTAREGLIESDSKKSLINGGTTDDGTPLYRLDGKDFDTAIPVGKEAGSYKVYFMISSMDKDLYDDSEVGSLTVVISKPEPIKIPDRYIYVTVSGSGGMSETEVNRITIEMNVIRSYGLIPYLIITAKDGEACISEELLDVMVKNQCLMLLKDKNVMIEVPNVTLAGLDARDSIVLSVENLDPSSVVLPERKDGQVYDITLLVDGAPYTKMFDEPLGVTIKMEEEPGINLDTVELYHVNGSHLEKVDMHLSNVYVLFDAPHLSRYAIVYEKHANVWVNTGGAKVYSEGWAYSGGYYVKSFPLGATEEEILNDLGALENGLDIRIGQSSSSKVLDMSGMTIKIEWLPMVDVLLVAFIAIVVGLVLFITFHRKREHRN